VELARFGNLSGGDQQPDEMLIGKVSIDSEGAQAFLLMKWKTKRKGDLLFEDEEYYYPIYIKKEEYEGTTSAA
jgi:hypothetical protein